MNSECSQQKRANENKHSAYRQYIETQGKVIGLDDSKHSRLPSGRRKTAPAGSRGRSRRNTHRARCFGDGDVGRLGRTATGSPPETVRPLGGGVEEYVMCQRYKWAGVPSHCGAPGLAGSVMGVFDRVVPRAYSAVARLNSIATSSVCNTHNSRYRCRQSAI